jgi:CheY-like chemotaxis protein
VLVVEDDQDLREIITMTLEVRGHHVVAVSDGGEALAWLRAQGPSPMPCVVLLDLMMPGMNGFELSATMHADPTLTTIPVVIITGAPLLAKQRASELYGEVLSKPIELAALVSTVRRFCPAPAASHG